MILDEGDNGSMVTLRESDRLAVLREANATIAVREVLMRSDKRLAPVAHLRYRDDRRSVHVGRLFLVRNGN